MIDNATEAAVTEILKKKKPAPPPMPHQYGGYGEGMY